MKKKLCLALTVILIYTCLSHFPAVKGSYALGTPYHPFCLFSLDVKTVESISLGNGMGDFYDYTEQEEIAALCEQLNSFRYVVFIPNHLPSNGGWSSAFRIRYTDGSFQWIHVRPGCFSIPQSGWYLGFGGGSKEISDLIKQL